MDLPRQQLLLFEVTHGVDGGRAQDRAQLLLRERQPRELRQDSDLRGRVLFQPVVQQQVDTVRRDLGNHVVEPLAQRHPLAQRVDPLPRELVRAALPALAVVTFGDGHVPRVAQQHEPTVPLGHELGQPLLHRGLVKRRGGL